MTDRVVTLRDQRELRDETRYLLRLREVLQAFDDPTPGAEGLARLNRDLDRLPRATWLTRLLG